MLLAASRLSQASRQGQGQGQGPATSTQPTNGANVIATDMEGGVFSVVSLRSRQPTQLAQPAQPGEGYTAEGYPAEGYTAAASQPDRSRTAVALGFRTEDGLGALRAIATPRRLHETPLSVGLGLAFALTFMQRGPADVLAVTGRWGAEFLFGGPRYLSATWSALAPLLRGDAVGWVLGRDLTGEAPRASVTRFNHWAADFGSPLTDRLGGSYAASFCVRQGAGYGAQIAVAAGLLSYGAGRWVSHGSRWATLPLVTGVSLSARVLWDLGAAWSHLGIDSKSGAVLTRPCWPHDHRRLPRLVQGLGHFTSLGPSGIYAGLALVAVAIPALAAWNGFAAAYGGRYRERHIRSWLGEARNDELQSALDRYEPRDELVAAYQNRERSPERWREAAENFVHRVLQNQTHYLGASGWLGWLQGWGGTVALWTGPLLGLPGSSRAAPLLVQQGAMIACAGVAVSQFLRAKSMALAVAHDHRLGGGIKPAAAHLAAAACSLSAGLVALGALAQRIRDPGEGPATLAGMTNAWSWTAIAGLQLAGHTLSAWAATHPESRLRRLRNGR